MNVEVCYCHVTTSENMKTCSDLTYMERNWQVSFGLPRLLCPQSAAGIVSGLPSKTLQYSI